MNSAFIISLLAISSGTLSAYGCVPYTELGAVVPMPGVYLRTGGVAPLASGVLIDTAVNVTLPYFSCSVSSGMRWYTYGFSIGPEVTVGLLGFAVPYCHGGIRAVMDLASPGSFISMGLYAVPGPPISDAEQMGAFWVYPMASVAVGYRW